MRVLILNDVAAPMGGAEILSLGIRDELRARGHDARCFASTAHLEGAPTPADYACFGTTSRLRTLNRTLNPDAYRRLRGVLAEFRPDVVHVRMFMSQLSPLILPLLRAVPTIYHAAWYELICPTGHKLLPDHTVCRQPAGRACRGCLSRQAWSVLMFQRQMWSRWRGSIDLFVANSDTMRRRLEEHGIAPTVRVYNGVPARAPRPPLGDPPVVAYAGRLSHEKGVEVLVRAFATAVRVHPQAQLLLIGDGPERARLEQLVASAGLTGRVRMTGQLSRGRTEDELDRAWAQVAPSLLEEPFGNVVAEAMMRGTAVIATGHGGPAEIIDEGNTGLLVPPGDVAALAGALGSVFDDRDRAERMGKTGRERNHIMLGLEACVDQFVDLYRDVCERTAP